MSIRYGISLTLDPGFTAGLHRARQVICSQYGCWAAEMHSVHVPMTGYFPCSEVAVSTLDTGLEAVAVEFRKEHSGALVTRQGIVAEAGEQGSIYLEFSGGEEASPEAHAVRRLRDQAEATLAGLNPAPDAGSQPLRFALLQYAGLPPQVFQGAVRFAEGVVNGLELADHIGLAELVLLRYESDAATEDWRDGGWAVDLRWQMINCYPLTIS